MSQTETILLVVLGFSLAALIALFIGRFVWSLGLRLGARRMQKQVPSTVAALQTERDRLRAEYAMLSQRLGSRLEGVKLSVAEQMAEVTRHRNRVETLSAELATKDAIIATRDSEVAALKDQVMRLESDVAALQLAATLPAAEPFAPLPEAQHRLQMRIEQLNSLSRSIGSAHSLPLTASDPALDKGLVTASHETDDIQQELQRLDAEWARKLEELSQTSAETATDEKPGAVANVISLANRIRALKKDIAK